MDVFHRGNHGWLQRWDNYYFARQPYSRRPWMNKAGWMPFVLPEAWPMGLLFQQTFWLAVAGKIAGVINTVNNGWVPFKCITRPGEKASMQNSSELKYVELNGVQLLLFLVNHTCWFPALKCQSIWKLKVDIMTFATAIWSAWMSVTSV